MQSCCLLPHMLSCNFVCSFLPLMCLLSLFHHTGRFHNILHGRMSAHRLIHVCKQTSSCAALHHKLASILLHIPTLTYTPAPRHSLPQRQPRAAQTQPAVERAAVHQAQRTVGGAVLVRVDVEVRVGVGADVDGEGLGELGGAAADDIELREEGGVGRGVLGGVSFPGGFEVVLPVIGVTGRKKVMRDGRRRMVGGVRVSGWESVCLYLLWAGV